MSVGPAEKRLIELGFLAFGSPAAVAGAGACAALATAALAGALSAGIATMTRSELRPIAAVSLVAAVVPWFIFLGVALALAAKVRLQLSPNSSRLCTGWEAAIGACGFAFFLHRLLQPVLNITFAPWLTILYAVSLCLGGAATFAGWLRAHLFGVTILAKRWPRLDRLDLFCQRYSATPAGKQYEQMQTVTQAARAAVAVKHARQRQMGGTPNPFRLSWYENFWQSRYVGLVSALGSLLIVLVVGVSMLILSHFHPLGLGDLEAYLQVWFSNQHRVIMPAPPRVRTAVPDRRADTDQDPEMAALLKRMESIRVQQ